MFLRATLVSKSVADMHFDRFKVIFYTEYNFFKFYSLSRSFRITVTVQILIVNYLKTY